MRNRETLERLVCQIVSDAQNGIAHVQIVKCILLRGYRHPGNLSEDVMRVVNQLSRRGVFHKNKNTRTVMIADRSKSNQCSA